MTRFFLLTVLSCITTASSAAQVGAGDPGPGRSRDSVGAPGGSAVTEPGRFPIGAATARGFLSVESARVKDIASIFEGSLLQTFETSSSLRMTSGVHVSLGPYSAARVYGSHVVLDRGTSELVKSGGKPFQIDVLDLHVVPAGETAAVRVQVPGYGVVRVTGISGTARVFNAAGIQIANVAKGTALDFAQTRQAPTSSQITGTLKKSGGGYVLTDETTQVTAEVRGGKLDRFVGKRIVITGDMEANAKPVPGASAVIVLTHEPILAAAAAGVGSAAGGAAAGGAAAGTAAGTVAGGAVATGLSVTAAIGIVAGVAAAAAGAAFGIGELKAGGTQWRQTTSKATCTCIWGVTSPKTTCANASATAIACKATQEESDTAADATAVAAVKCEDDCYADSCVVTRARTFCAPQTK